MYMKSFKDLRRRTVEAVLVQVGASEKTVDDDFEILHTKFVHLCGTMLHCSTSATDTSNHQKNDLEQANDFSKVMSKIYSEQLDTEVTSKWPQSSCALKNPSLSRKYSECCTSAQAIIGASCAAVYREEGLGPFKSAAMSMAPSVEETCKQRIKIVTDFDSYRRRLKALETKKISIETSTGKEKALSDLNVEISKYYGKVKQAEQAYSEFNEKTKGDIIVNRVSHDELLDNLLVATIVCQADLHQRIANQLEQLVLLCPPDQVKRLRDQIEDHICKGGPPVREEGKESGGALKSFARSGAVAQPAQGGYTPPASDAGSSYDAPYKQPTYVPTAQVYQQPPPQATAPAADSGSQGVRRQFAVESKEPPRHELPPAAPEAQKPMVLAKHDHVADADDELNFFAGDRVEVLETRDDGWWVGRCRGKTGLFPVNYVVSIP